MARIPDPWAERFRRMIGPPLAAAVMAAALCAPGIASAANAPDDPLEPFNRAMFAFNRALVLEVVNPTMDNVGPYIPDAVKAGTYNFYRNLTEIEFIINGALRRDLHGMAVPTGRLLVNSTVGIAGLFDVATPMGLQRQESDFIESACQIGLPPGRYLVLPLVGPASLNYAALIGAGAAVQIYAFSYVSYSLVAFDVITDLGVAAGGLRYANTAAEASGQDPYTTLRESHQAYVTLGCDAPSPAVESPAGESPAGEATVAKGTVEEPSLVFRRQAATPSVSRSLAERVSPR